MIVYQPCVGDKHLQATIATCPMGKEGPTARYMALNARVGDSKLCVINHQEYTKSTPRASFAFNPHTFPLTFGVALKKQPIIKHSPDKEGMSLIGAATS